MADPTTFFALLLIGAFVYWIDINKRKRHLRPVPPGPRPLPIVGNIFSIPMERPWLTYKDWAEKYGSDIFFLDLPRQPTVIVNSFDDAVELMEKRSKLYSDRYSDIMSQLTGWSWAIGSYPYGQDWRDRRRNFHQYFNQSAVQKYHPIQTREIKLFLQRALEFSDKVDTQSISLTFASIILEATYGIRIHSLEDELASLSQNAIAAFNLIKNLGEYWVEFFPWLRHVPAWVPWSRAKQDGNHFWPIVEATRSTPFEVVSIAVDEGTAAPSIVQDTLQKLNDEYDPSNSSDKQELLKKRQAAKDAAGIAYAGAVDTQASGICWFLIGMSVAPEVQRKAQAELDTVLGARLPIMEDLTSLPYIQAVFLETMRWAPAVPTCVYHRLVDGEDDELHGYRIPAGSTIIPNIWAMLHNPADYPDPERFDPDRFLLDGRLNPKVRDPLSIVFGFGRRICPGRYLAIDSLTLLFASLLCVFNVESTLTEGDRTVPKATTGLISYPTEVPCRLKPRNAASIALINAEARVAAANKSAGA